MRKSGFSLLTTLIVGVCALPSAAFAQDAPAAPAPAPAPAPAAAAPGVAPATPATQPAAAPGAAAPPPTAPAPDANAAPAPPAPPAEAATPPAPTYPATTITGFVEGGYNHVFGAPHNPTEGDAIPTRAYDPENGFVLHLAHIALKHQLNENVYGFIAFNAGADSTYNHDPSGVQRTLFDVPEAYAVATGYNLTFTAGKFTTYEGIEVYQGPANPTITRGFLYWLAEPVTHVGAKLHYTAGPVDIGVGVVNGWDTNNGVFATGDNNNQKTFIFRAAVTPSPAFFAALSGTYGVEKPGQDTDPRYSIDLTGAAVATPALTINFQANLGGEKNSDWIDPTKSATWIGFGIQPLLKVDAESLGVRFEYFSDSGLSRSGLGPAINPKDAMGALVDPTNTKDKVGLWNLTITPGYTIAGALLARAEFRVDGASESALWAGKKTQETISLGASYTF
jgi:Putative beta-barrel porin-2, OmpL-like. bbp2